MGAAAPAISALLTARWTALWTSCSLENLTSVLVGWTFTSTSSGTKSTNTTAMAYLPRLQQPAIGLIDSMGDGLAPYRAAIDEEALIAAIDARELRVRDEPIDFHHAGLETDRDELPGDVLAEDVGDAVEPDAGRGGREHLPAAMHQPERDIRVGHREPADDLGDVAHLGLSGLEKLEPGGGVEEELADADRCPLRRADGFEVDDRPGLDFQPRAVGLGLVLGDHLDHRNRRDARQGLSPETQRADVVQVLGIPNLGRGMALEAEHGVLAGHARCRYRRS